MKKKLIFLICITLGVLKIFGQTNDLREILTAAQKGYAGYLEKIPPGKELLYGFNNRGEFVLAKIGKPYQLITLNKKFFNDSIISDGDYFVTTGEWRIPITVNNDFRVLITVAKMSKEWEVVGLGGATLAKELGEFYKSHPSTNESEKLLRVYQMVSDFIIASSNSSSWANAYPLESAKISLELKDSSPKYYPLSELLLVLKKNIQNK